jgi:hypothetical protein
MFYYDDSEIDDARMNVIERARQYNSGTKEEIELYERLFLALSLIKNDGFRIDGSRICDGIEFYITTPYPDGLPESVGSMFFNLSTDYSVKIRELPLYANSKRFYCSINSNGLCSSANEMNFEIKVKKI